MPQFPIVFERVAFVRVRTEYIECLYKDGRMSLEYFNGGLISDGRKGNHNRMW